MTRQLKSLPRHPNSAPSSVTTRLSANSPSGSEPVRAMDCRQEISAEIIRLYRRQQYQ